MTAFLRRSLWTTGMLIAGTVSREAGPIVVAAGNLRDGVAPRESSPQESTPTPPDDSLLRELWSRPEVAGEPVSCELASGGDGDEKKLVLLTSSGLGAWTNGYDAGLVPNENLTQAFRELVLQLPASAWAEGETEGVRRKAEAAERSANLPNQNSFRDEDLYAGLDVVIINDACLLKDSFWNEDNPDFSHPSGVELNYKIAGVRTSPEVARPYFGGQLDGSWCVNFAADKPGYLGSLGFNLSRVHQISLWDTLAPLDLTKDLLKMRAGQKSSRPREAEVADMSTDAAKELVSRLAAADIVLVNGGNPDFLTFVLQGYAAEAMVPVLENVKAGRTIWFGHSAGSMVGGADMGLSYENDPGLLRQLRKFNTSGFGVAGKCAIRPHVADMSWSLAASVYGKLKGVNMVLLPNGNALRCSKGSCSRIGAPGAPESHFSGFEDPHLERLADAFVPPVAALEAASPGAVVVYP